MFTAGGSKYAFNRRLGCQHPTFSRLLSRFQLSGTVFDRPHPPTTEPSTFNHHWTECLHPGLTSKIPLLVIILHRQTNIMYLWESVSSQPKPFHQYAFLNKTNVCFFLLLFHNMQPMRFYMLSVYCFHKLPFGIHSKK